jgi:hypothetical protein
MPIPSSYMLCWVDVVVSAAQRFDCTDTESSFVLWIIQSRQGLLGCISNNSRVRLKKVVEKREKQGGKKRRREAVLTLSGGRLLTSCCTGLRGCS